jgi:uncharacterized protein YjbI with pentapeptide repeats
MAHRLSYEDSCRELQQNGWLDAGDIPPLPSRQPRYDDPEPLGVQFFRTQVADAKFENLTLSRTFFARSEIRDTSFKGSDLSESSLCWNDFVSVDFSECDLSRSDLRGALFESVNFSGANLSQSDLRRSGFENCNFSGAHLHGAKLTRAQTLRLSPNQEAEVDWQESEGEEPDGG